MRNTAIVGIVMLGIGFAIGWVAKPGTDPAKPPVAAVSAPKPAAPAPKTAAAQATADSAKPGKRAIRPDPPAKPAPGAPTPEQMEQAKKMQTQMAKNMVDRQRQKFEKQIDRLTENLALSADQKSKLTAWLDARLEGFDNADLTDPASAGKLMEASKELTDEKLQAQLAGTLDADQQAALADYRNRERAGKVDALALKSLSNLQGIIQFEEGQRDKVYELLTESAEETLAAQAESQDFGSMFTEGMGIEMDPYGLGIQQAMTEAMGDPTKFQDNPEQQQSMVKTMRQVIGERIDAKVEKLRPVLSDKQLETYRNELQTKGLGIYGTVLDSMDKAAEGKRGGDSPIAVPEN